MYIRLLCRQVCGEILAQGHHETSVVIFIAIFPPSVFVANQDRRQEKCVRHLKYLLDDTPVFEEAIP